MWALIAVVIIALLLILTAPKPKVENARAAKLGDFQFPRSNQGDPVPWFRGTVRLKSPNTLWDGDYTPVPITVKQKTGLFSSKRVTTGYKYHIGLDLCWALNGTHTITLRKLWSDKYVLWTGSVNTRTTIDINQPNLFGGQDQRGGMVGAIDFYPGSFDEPRSSYLAEKADPDVPAYIGQCRTVFHGSAITEASGFYFGTTTTINAISAEMSLLTSYVAPAYAVMPNGFDSNPMEILYSAFTEEFGMLGADVNDIDMPSWQAAAQTLYNEKMGMSILVQTSVTGKDIADEALRVADGILYQNPDTGKIVCKLIRDDYDVATLITLDQSTVMELSDFSKTTWDQAFNQCRVTFTNRADDYANGVATQQDFALLNFQERVRNTDISVPGCYDPTEATALAARQLSLMSVPLFQIEIRCKRQAAVLNPGDVFVFNWTPYGLSNMVMRVQKIDKGTLQDGTVTINAIQDRFASSLALFAPPEPTGWTPVDTSAQPVATRLFFEAPKWFQQFLASNLTDGQAAWYVGAKPPGQASVGMDVQTSATGTWNDTVDSQLQRVYDGTFAVQTAFTKTDGQANGLSATGFTVELVDRPSEFINQAGTFDSTGQWLILVDGEFMQPATMTDNGDGTYTFTNVYRALLDSDFADHAVGAVGYLIKQSDGLLDPITSDTATLHARILDITPTSTLDPTQALVDNVAGNMRARRASPPDYVQINGSRTPAPAYTNQAITLSWRERNRNTVALQPYSAASEAQEAGVDYAWRIRVNGGAWTGFTYATGTTTTIAAPGASYAGNVDIQVFSRLNGNLSWTGDTCSIALSVETFNLLTAGSERLTNAGGDHLTHP